MNKQMDLIYLKTSSFTKKGVYFVLNNHIKLNGNILLKKYYDVSCRNQITHVIKKDVIKELILRKLSIYNFISFWDYKEIHQIL